MKIVIFLLTLAACGDNLRVSPDAAPYLGTTCTENAHWTCPPNWIPFGVCLCHPPPPWPRPRPDAWYEDGADAQVDAAPDGGGEDDGGIAGGAAPDASPP